jgi:hypothetical protein
MAFSTSLTLKAAKPVGVLNCLPRGRLNECFVNKLAAVAPVRVNQYRLIAVSNWCGLRLRPAGQHPHLSRLRTSHNPGQLRDRQIRETIRQGLRLG